MMAGQETVGRHSCVQLILSVLHLEGGWVHQDTLEGLPWGRSQLDQRI